MRHVRLFWQIFPACAGITVISLVLAAWLVTSVGQDFHLEQLKKNIRERALLIEPTIHSLSQGPAHLLEDYVRTTGRRASTRITVIDGRGTVLADSSENADLMENHSRRPEVAAALGGEMGYDLRSSRTLAAPMLYAAIPIRLGSGGHPGVLRLAISLSPVDRLLQDLRRSMLGIGLLVGIIAVLLSLYSARRISRPLEKMKLAAEQLSSGRFNGAPPDKISCEGMSLEMAALAGSINQMAEQIAHRVRIITQQRNQMEAVFSSMADAVVVIDSERRILRMNRAAIALFTLPARAIQGKLVQGVIRSEALQELIDQTLGDNVARTGEATLFNTPTPTILKAHVVPLRDEAGDSMGALLVMNDLTKLNRLEMVRQDFVANVSHELKTPITAIKGYVETLLDGALDDHDTARRFLGIVIRQVHRLDAIIDDLLTLSRIENQETHSKIVLETVEVGQVLEAALQSCAVLADEKEVVVQVDCDEPCPAQANLPLLEQAIINLLNNAITYSPPGSVITLRCQEHRTVEGEPRLRISVADHGPGIAREHLPRLFERFYRCDRSRSREQGGTGLGLAIVKHIAQAHHGEVEVESTPGKGSTFTLVIPAAHPENVNGDEEEETGYDDADE
ncbi:MAG: ATP-binding protein [Desulfobulbus sp.]|jgi:two-component system phosphate regulon sensor histidine kinase PhoR